MTAIRSALGTFRGTVVAGAALLLAVLVGGWVLLLGPATGALGTAQQDLTDRVDANDLLRLRLVRLQDQASDLGTTDATAAELAALFPPTADQPDFLGLVDEAARAAGLRPAQVTTLAPSAPVVVDPATGAPVDAAAPPPAPVEGEDGTVQAAPPPPPPTLAAQTVTLTVDASYAQAERLLDALASMDRALLLRAVSVSGSAEPGGGGAYTLSLTGLTFVAAPLERPADLG